MSHPFEQRRVAQAAIEELRKLRADAEHPTHYLNARIRKTKGFRLAHLVMQGGGTLGIAHVGFLRGLEHAGIHFVGAAGTSAGAIVALLMVAARKRALNEEVALSLLPVLQAMPAASFIDGPYLARRFIKYALSRSRSGVSEYFIPALASASRILRTYGLNPGRSFEEWLDVTLARTFNIRSQSDLNRQVLQYGRNFAPALTEARSASQELLHIIATAMPLGIAIRFPKDLAIFAAKYEKRSPALMARASMSVPLFFEPYELDLRQSTWRPWVVKHLKGAYSDAICAHAAKALTLSFIDGGLLSNFPIDAFGKFGGSESVFDDPEARLIPTLGIALVSAAIKEDTPRRGSVGAVITHVGQAVNAMRHQRDRQAIGYALATRDATVDRPPTYIAFVDVGSHNWLNFMLSIDDMRDLFERGLTASLRFLKDLERR